MTPIKADFVAVLAAVQDRRLLSDHQIGVIVAALRGAADLPDQEATSNKSEASLLPAVMAKMEEGCDLLREMRDMMRRRDPEALHARSRLRSYLETGHVDKHREIGSEATPEQGPASCGPSSHVCKE